MVLPAHHSDCGWEVSATALWISGPFHKLFGISTYMCTHKIRGKEKNEQIYHRTLLSGPFVNLWRHEKHCAERCEQSLGARRRGHRPNETLLQFCFVSSRPPRWCVFTTQEGEVVAVGLIKENAAVKIHARQFVSSIKKVRGGGGRSGSPGSAAMAWGDPPRRSFPFIHSSLLLNSASSRVSPCPSSSAHVKPTHVIVSAL